MFTKTSFVAFTAATLMSLAGGAQAASVNQDEMTAPVTIQTADLNLDSRAGAQVLLSRITYGARIVCGDEPDIRQIQQRLAYRACVKSKIDETVAAIHAPMLASLNGSVGPQILASSGR